MQGILNGLYHEYIHVYLELAHPALVGDSCQYFLTVFSPALYICQECVVWDAPDLVYKYFSCLSLYWCVSVSPTVKFGEWVGEVWWSDPRIRFPLQRDIAAVCARTLSHHCYLHSCYTGDFTHMYTSMTHAQSQRYHHMWQIWITTLHVKTKLHTIHVGKIRMIFETNKRMCQNITFPNIFCSMLSHSARLTYILQSVYICPFKFRQFTLRNVQIPNNVQGVVVEHVPAPSPSHLCIHTCI